MVPSHAGGRSCHPRQFLNAQDWLLRDVVVVSPSKADDLLSVTIGPFTS